MDSFTQLPLRPATLAALARMEITAPTPIQAGAIPPLLAGRDLIGQAKTGSGKTLAFAIPLVERLDPRRRAVQALVLVPTRELALQVAEVVAALAEGRLRTVPIYGGRAMGPQIAALRAGAQIVVGTPGRVLDHLGRGTLALDEVRYLVLDEADEMLDRGFAPDVERILGRTPAARQTALFSATLPEWVGGIAARHLREPVTVQVETRPEEAPPIEQTVYAVPDAEKFTALQRLLDARGTAAGEAGATLVFGRTKHGVKKLGKQLERLGYPVGALQGNLSQNARDRVMADFRSGRLPILLATNVAARGLDVETIDLVVNYDLPESPELFTHRIGRTGRMGRAGRAVTLLTGADVRKWREISAALGRRIAVQPFPGMEAEAPVAEFSAHSGRGVAAPRATIDRPARPIPAGRHRRAPAETAVITGGRRSQPAAPAPGTRPEGQRSAARPTTESPKVAPRAGARPDQRRLDRAARPAVGDPDREIGPAERSAGSAARQNERAAPPRSPRPGSVGARSGAKGGSEARRFGAAPRLPGRPGEFRSAAAAAAHPAGGADRSAVRRGWGSGAPGHGVGGPERADRPAPVA